MRISQRRQDRRGGGGIIIKELKYGVYRFYFITEGYKVKFLKSDELRDLLIKFVRMSDKDRQEEVISEIKSVLKASVSYKGYNFPFLRTGIVSRLVWRVGKFQVKVSLVKGKVYCYRRNGLGYISKYLSIYKQVYTSNITHL